MTTKAQNILANVHTTLEAINGGSTYVMMVEAVYGHDKPYKEPQTSEDKDRPYLNIGMPSVETIEEANAKTIKRMSIPVEGVSTYDAADPEASRAAAQNLMGDVEKALQVDHTRGTYAIDTTVTAESQPSMIESKLEGRPGCITTDQTVMIDFGHSRTDPSSD
jgi:hypothetical protein